MPIPAVDGIIAGVTSLREKQTANRRRQMLDVAEVLIRQCNGTDFSMRALALVAEVSPTTPYNFFGSKEGLLFELLTRNLRALMEEALKNSSSEDPVDHAIEAGEAAVRIFLRDPVLMRPLYQVLFGVSDPVRHPEFLRDAFEFYIAALDPLVKQKLIRDKHEQRLLATSLMSQFLGVLDLWIHEDIDDQWFLAQIVYGFSHLLWPLARGKSLERLQTRTAQARKILSNRNLVPRFAI